MMFFRFVLLTILASLIAACTSQPQKQTPPPASVSAIKEWSTEGRVGIRTKDDAVSGNFDWHHTEQTFDLHIYGPFGQGSTKLTKDKEGKVTLYYKGKTVVGYDAGALLNQQLGWQFPVKQVVYWIKGQPYPNTPSKITYRSGSKLASKIIQDGWTINYEKYTSDQGLSLPQKLQVTRMPYRVNLIINQWNIQ